MNKIKKLSLVFLFILVSNIKVFAGSGFELMLNVPLGASFGIFQGTITTTTIPTYPSTTVSGSIGTSIGFDSGVQAQVGYMLDFGGFAISLLGDLGYSYDSYRFSLSGSSRGMYLHSFQIGAIPKFNFGTWALGIGGGVKIPVSGTYGFDDSSYTYNFSSSEYDPPVIGYVKLTIDQYFYINDLLAIGLGAYIGYDIGLQSKTEEARVDSFDIGIQLGFKFGPRPGY